MNVEVSTSVMWWFVGNFFSWYIAISLRCSTERNLSGQLVSLAAWQFLFFTALFSNDTVIRLIRCFCFKKIHPCVVRCLSNLGKALFATLDCISFL